MPAKKEPTTVATYSYSNLEEVEAQMAENRNAKREGREPEVLKFPRHYTNEATNLLITPEPNKTYSVEEPVEVETELQLITENEPASIADAKRRSEALGDNVETKDKVVPEKEEEKKDTKK